MPLPAAAIAAWAAANPVLAGAITAVVGNIATQSKIKLFSVDPTVSKEQEDYGAARSCFNQGLIPQYGPNRTVIGCVPANNDVVPDTKETVPIPTVSVPPTRHYVEPYYPPNNPEPPVPPPQMPPRRLPIAPPPVGTLPTGTDPNRSVTVKIPTQFAFLGDLLHEPITRSPIRIQVQNPAVLVDNFEAKQKTAGFNFFLWLLTKESQDFEEAYKIITGEDVIHDLKDTAIALFSRDYKKSGNPETFAIFGCEAIAELINDWTTRNYIDNWRVGGTVPLNYELIDTQDAGVPPEGTLKNFAVGNIGKGGAGSSVNAGDLSEVIAILEILSQRLGTDQFPVSLPKRLIYPGATGEEQIDNLVEMLGYQVRQFDKAVGYLPQKVKVLDTNAAQAGNQSVEVNIHSFADFARETLQFLIDTEGDGDVLGNMAVRTLYETGAVHQLIVQANAMLDAIVEHLDFKEKWTQVDVPFAFDPYAGQKGNKAGFGTGEAIPLTEAELEKLLPDLLKEKLIKIRILKNDQKKTLNDIMEELLKESRTAAAGVSEAASESKLEKLVAAAQTALQLQNGITRNNVRKALTAGDMRTRKAAPPPPPPVP